VTNFLASVETNVGILAVCLTTLRPFFAWVLDTANNLSFQNDSNSTLVNERTIIWTDQHPSQLYQFRRSTNRERKSIPWAHVEG